MIKRYRIAYFIIILIIVASTMLMFSCEKDKIEEEPEEIDPLYSIDPNNSTYFYMGLYPQTISDVDVNLIKEGQLDSSTGWYMYEGNQYAVVKAQKIESGFNKILSNNQTVIEGKEYAFLVEPIKWKLIYNPTGEMLLLSDKIIDGSVYQNYETLEKFNDDYILENEVYANSYYHSIAREELNKIYQNAFKHYASSELDKIIVKEQDNINTNGGNKTMYSERQVNTLDTLFLLSYTDFNNPSYRISVSSTAEDYTQNRKKIVSDYAIVKGVPSYSGRYGVWWTRSTSDREKGSTIVRIIDVLGNLTEGDIAISSGIVPAIWVKK